jgi:E3 ubiquitin-protein ligase RNF10
MYFVQHASKSGLSLPNGFSNPAEVVLDQQNDTPAAAQLAPATEPKPIPSHFRPMHPRLNQHEPHHPDSPYYFYQALLHYYLAPLDIRILKSAFGNFASFPSTLLPRVERVSTGHIMDDELRKRTKYLSHLPYGCEVGFLECNWTDVVPPEILEPFKDEIEKRRKRNRDKETREERDRVRAEKAEDDARWATARRKRPSIPTESFSGDGFHPLAPSSLDANNASPPWPNRQGSSFASLASPSTSPSAPRTVWGTTLIAPASPEVHPQQPEQDGDDGWLHSWEQELLAENELIAQVAATSLAGQENTRPAGSGQGKKKKAKKITLMSTTARRAA